MEASVWASDVLVCALSQPSLIDVMSKIRLFLLSIFIVLLSPFAAMTIIGTYYSFNVISGIKHLVVSDLRPQPGSLQLKYKQLPSSRVEWLADIESYDVDESSGLATSNYQDNLLWTINDSGNDPILFGIDLNGQLRAVVEVGTDKNTDWEGLASFSFNGKSYLLIGDIGDNFRWRETLHLILIQEPTIPATTTQQPLEPIEISIKPNKEIEYSYPEGFRDAEGLAYDPIDQLALVISKRNHPPELYGISLDLNRPASTSKQVAQLIAQLPHLPQPVEEEVDMDNQAVYRHSPTGMDLRTINGKRNLLITTYQHAYLYAADAYLNGQQPFQIRLPRIGQREAIVFAKEAAQGTNTQTVQDPQETQKVFISRERIELGGAADFFQISFDWLETGIGQ